MIHIPIVFFGHIVSTTATDPLVVKLDPISVAFGVDKNLVVAAVDAAAEVQKKTDLNVDGVVNNAFLSINGFDLQTDLRMDREDTSQGRGGGLLVYVRTGVKILKLDLECNFWQHCKFLIGDIFILIWPPSWNNSISTSAYSSRLNRHRLTE